MNQILEKQYIDLKNMGNGFSQSFEEYKNNMRKEWEFLKNWYKKYE